MITRSAEPAAIWLRREPSSLGDRLLSIGSEGSFGERGEDAREGLLHRLGGRRPVEIHDGRDAESTAFGTLEPPIAADLEIAAGPGDLEAHEAGRHETGVIVRPVRLEAPSVHSTTASPQSTSVPPLA